MSDFKAVGVNFASGAKVMLYAARPLQGSTRPVVLMLHGILRSAQDLGPWGDLLDALADVVLLDFPGHGRSEPLGPPTLAAFADIVEGVLSEVFADRTVLLVGESAGALVALEVGGRPDTKALRAILAVDPPMTTAKQWYLAAYFHWRCRNRPLSPFIEDLWRELFGITRDAHEERVYYPLIGALRVPAVIVTGDVPLLPPRPLADNETTCVFEDVDREVLEERYPGKVEVRKVAGSSHLLLVEARPQLLEIIRGMLAGLSRGRPEAGALDAD